MGRPSASEVPGALWIIWGALVVAVFVYVGVARVLPQVSGLSLSPSLFLTALAALAALQGLATLVVRQRLLVAPARAGRLDVHSAAGAQRLFQISLICFVLSESIAIYGLVYAVIVGFGPPTLGFAAAGLVLLALHAPRLGPLQAPPGALDLPQRPDPIG